MLWLHSWAQLLLLFLQNSPFQVGMMSGEHLLQSFTEMVDEMPPIGDLNGLWRSTACAISPRRVPRSRLMTRNGGMLLEPGGKGLGGGVLKQIKWSLLLQINQDGAVALDCCRQAHSSTIRTAEEEGKEAWRTRRKMLAELHFIASRWLSRAPDLPPMASPMKRKRSCAELVR